MASVRTTLGGRSTWRNWTDTMVLVGLELGAVLMDDQPPSS
jgi:hypothetical protein